MQAVCFLVWLLLTKESYLFCLGLVWIVIKEGMQGVN